MTNVIGATMVLVVGLIYTLIVTRILGVENKGALAYMNAISAILMLFGYRGHDAAFYYTIANRDSEMESFYYHSVYLLKDILVMIVILSMSILSFLIVTDNALFQKIALGILVNVPVLMLFHILSRFLLAMSYFKEYYIANLIKTAINLLLIVLLMTFTDIDLLLICFFTAAISTFFVTLFWFIRFKELFWCKATATDFDRDSFKQYSRNAFVGNSASLGNEYTDQLIVGTFLSFRDLGIYSVAYNASKLLYKPLASVFNIIYNKIGKEKELFKINYYFHKSLFWIWSLGLLMFVLLAEDLILFLFGIEFISAAKYMPYLAFGLLFFTITRRLAQTVLLASGDASSSSKIQLFNLITSVILYLLLGPFFQLFGVTIATMLSLILSSSFALFVLYRKKPFILKRLFF